MPRPRATDLDPGSPRLILFGVAGFTGLEPGSPEFPAGDAGQLERLVERLA